MDVRKFENEAYEKMPNGEQRAGQGFHESCPGRKAVKK